MTDPVVPTPTPTPRTNDLKVLVEYVNELSRNAESLRLDVKVADARAQSRNRINMALLGMLVLFVGAILVVAFQNNTIAQQTRTTNDKMADCSTPGGKCYEEGAVRTGNAIKSVLRAQIALGECSRLYPGEAGPAFDVKLRDCVYERIATDPGPPPPVLKATPPALTPNPKPSGG